MDRCLPIPFSHPNISNRLMPCLRCITIRHSRSSNYIGFDRAVNVTLGLPFIRTSVDHGTAIDIAGTGKADAGSMEAAVEACYPISWEINSPAYKGAPFKNITGQAARRVRGICTPLTSPHTMHYIFDCHCPGMYRCISNIRQHLTIKPIQFPPESADCNLKLPVHCNVHSGFYTSSHPQCHNRLFACGQTVPFKRSNLCSLTRFIFNRIQFRKQMCSDESPGINIITNSYINEHGTPSVFSHVNGYCLLMECALALCDEPRSISASFAFSNIQNKILHFNIIM